MFTPVWVRSQEGAPREKRTTLREVSGRTSNLMTAGEWGAPMRLQIGRGVTGKAEGNFKLKEVLNHKSKGGFYHWSEGTVKL